jgi:hypothetical protein
MPARENGLSGIAAVIASGSLREFRKTCLVMMDRTHSIFVPGSSRRILAFDF